MEAKYTVLAPLFVEVDVDTPLTRSAFREADQHPIASELIDALSRRAPAPRGCAR